MDKIWQNITEIKLFKQRHDAENNTWWELQKFKAGLYLKNKEMNKTTIKAEVVADSLSIKGDRLTSLKITFPRIILAEINTHRMLSKNTSSSRAIPFKKMVEAVKNDPFIPIAWQKHHSGMQGSEYLTGYEHDISIKDWLNARDSAVSWAKDLYKHGVTKQLANRLLEPFMWTTMLITGSKEGWNNFFSLRAPQYTGKYKTWKSWKEMLGEAKKDENLSKEDYNELENANTLFKLKGNKGQAEIHIMDLAEKIYDAMNESIPNQLEVGEWHIPFTENLNLFELAKMYPDADEFQNVCVKISTAMAARTSYTIVGEEKEIDYNKMIELHDRLISQDPPHSSCLEHCNRAMTDEEYESFIKGNIDIGFNIPKEAQGWCANIKGFIPYRYMVDNNLKM